MPTPTNYFVLFTKLIIYQSYWLYIIKIGLHNKELIITSSTNYCAPHCINHFAKLLL